jgi:hypothetical protein
MLTREYTTKRLIAQGPEEKAIVKSWGSLWQRFGSLERSGKPIYLIFGDWSGYRSSQYRITHVDFAGYYETVSQKLDDKYRGTVQFTDNTTMTVWVQCVTREQILERKLSKRESYNRLINDSVKSGKSYYKVGEES